MTTQESELSYSLHMRSQAAHERHYLHAVAAAWEPESQK